MLLLRAPAWPVGPGDPDAAADEARRAADLFPDVADNQLVLAETLEKTGATDAARVAYARALELAAAAAAAGDPDAGKARDDAAAGLRRAGG
jgi:predicted TPR repeat methyltransferase